ncbi:hypothetical protein SUDANB176_04625 [Streptomyces sp. enrichment culture]|uniref:hypothetical protein n=1 Tax=Streptomyces sp. enrichment culture TaxID=1795815 RepID=UPI003F56AF39
MSLVELIAQADERGLAVSGLACLDRCVPLLGGDDEVLRPLWSSLAEGAAAGDWEQRLEEARGKLDAAAGDEDEAAALAHRMLTAAPGRRSAAGLRVWADACSVAALRIHRLLDGAAARDDDADPALHAARAAGASTGGRTEGVSPLVAAELRRQITVLELLSAHGPAGLRGALEVATEGRRVLRAAVSRRSRRRD